jgi:hypothetical protein
MNQALYAYMNNKRKKIHIKKHKKYIFATETAKHNEGGNDRRFV